MNEKLGNVLLSIIKVIFIAILGISLLAVCFYGYNTDANLLNVFPLKNSMYLIFTMVIILAGIFLSKGIKNVFSQKNTLVINIKQIVIVSMILAIIQFIINYKRYFFYGWDAGFMYYHVMFELDNDLESINHMYFSAYSNNILILFFYTIVGIVTRFLHFDLETGLLFFNQILNFTTALLVYSVSNRYLKNKKVALLSYVLYQIYIGFSPWFIISYSDTIAMMFPLLTMFIYDVIRNTKSRNRKAVFIFLWGLEISIGYLIKPQTIIAFIAITINVIISFIFSYKEQIENIKKNIKIFFMNVLVFILAIVIFSNIFNFIIIPFLRLDIMDEYSFGPYHYLMMGLNNETDGAFYEPDVDFSINYDDVESRVYAEKEIIKKRLKEFGIIGLCDHILKKSVINYGDGTFAWNCEGDFIVGLSEKNTDQFSLKLCSWIFADTNNYKIFISINQIIWFSVLILSFVAGLLADKKQVCIFLLSIIGISLFQLIFEARARYLFAYAPLYVMFACYGFYILFIKLKGTKRNE